MRRLYQSIYLTMIAALVVVVVVAGAMLRFGGGAGPMAQGADMAADFVAAGLPDAARPLEEQRAAIRGLSRRLRSDISLFDADRHPIAVEGMPAPEPPRGGPPLSVVHDFRGPAWSLRLPDGRWLVARLAPGRGNPLIGVLIFLATIAGLVALCGYPVVRWLTRRIERLQQGVETLGSGDLSARVKVEGRDEVAQLARGFNAAAQKIEDLVGAHRMLLANASHELRTPLARVKLGLALYEETGDPKYRAALGADLDELDHLVDEILLTSRLDASAAASAFESIDLLALLAEECARYPEAELSGAPVEIDGDPRLLRRLARNLLDNARRHGAPPTRVTLRAEGDRVVIAVDDRGAGVPEGERERIFEPFHRLAGESTGSGLGLAIVRKIARLHGGDARALAAADGGARIEAALARRGVRP